MDRTQRDGFLLILVAAAGYGCFAIFTKSIFEAKQLGPLDVLMLRFFIATPITWVALWIGRSRLLKKTRQSPSSPAGDPAPLPIAMVRGRGWGKPLPHLRLLAMGLIFTLTAATAFFSLDRLPASTYTVVIYSYPAIVALLSLLLGDRLSPRAWLALGLTVLGIIFTVPDFSDGLGNLDGVLLTLLNAVFYATYIVLSGRLLRGHTDLAGASAWSITGSFLSLLVLTLIRGVTLPSDWGTWALLFGLAVVSTVIPIFAFYSGMQKLGAPRASILSTIEPVFTLILAALLLGERILPVQVVGAALILGSVILLQMGRMRRQSPNLTPDVQS